MAGGVGSRFWPSSTEEKPKQFLDILGKGESLLQMTFRRCAQIVEAQHIFVMTNKRYRDLVAQQLGEMPTENILCEPSRNNTAPCIAYAALRLKALADEAVFAVVPSDHVIEKEEVYINALGQALDFAEDNAAIVTLGIKPTRPDTGYGYIELEEMAQVDSGVVPVLAFKEKPDKETAQSFLEEGRYVWNAGMFVWSVSTLMESFEKLAPEVLQPLLRDAGKFGTSEEQAYIDQVYPLTPSISVDYAILEKATNVHCLPCDIGWSDLGTWASLYDYRTTGVNENVCQVKESSIEDVSGSIIMMEDDRTAVIRGLQDFIVVSTEDSLLIYPRDQEQELKQSIGRIE